MPVAEPLAGTAMQYLPERILEKVISASYPAQAIAAITMLAQKLAEQEGALVTEWQATHVQAAQAQHSAEAMQGFRSPGEVFQQSPQAGDIEPATIGAAA